MRKKTLIFLTFISTLLMLSTPVLSNVMADKIQNNEEIKEIEKLQFSLKKNKIQASIFINLDKFEKISLNNDKLISTGIIDEIIDLILAIIESIRELFWEGVILTIVNIVANLIGFAFNLLLKVLNSVETIGQLVMNILTTIRDILQAILDSIPDLIPDV